MGLVSISLNILGRLLEAQNVMEMNIYRDIYTVTAGYCRMQWLATIMVRHLKLGLLYLLYF